MRERCGRLGELRNTGGCANAVVGQGGCWGTVWQWTIMLNWRAEGDVVQVDMDWRAEGDVVQVDRTRGHVMENA